ncbi:MAG: InlB B-repeat-containing protein [Clostridia bacterium]|nr:InlB B-repeat-containing protein [Clostridia bacterium]
MAFAILTALVCFGMASFANEAPAASIKYHNLSYKSNVSIKYAVEVTSLPEGTGVADVIGVKVRKGDADYEADYEGQTFINGAEYSVFGFSELSAAEMTVDVYATPYVKISDTKIITGKTHKNSVLDYSYKILGKIEGGKELSPKVKALVAAMLSYGAAIQDYSGINVDRLADADYYQIKAINGTLPDGFDKGLYQEGDTVTLTASSKSGYIFKGWKNSADEYVGYDFGLSVTVVTANETYTAEYEADTSIKYVLDGGTLPAGSWDNYVLGSAFTLPLPAREGYTFIGWYTSSDLKESTKISKIPADATGGYTLYAKWEIVKVEYSITYNLNGGTLASGYPDKYEQGTAVTLPIPTRTGYLFKGWYNNASFNGSAITSVSTSSVGNLSLYAKWISQIEQAVIEQRAQIANNPFGTITTDLYAIADKDWGTPSATLKDEHPRLLITNDNLPLVKTMLNERNTTNTIFKNYVNRTLENDGILKDTSNNFDGYPLDIIQAKALAYLIYEDEYYGYQAILYMKNFLLSLNIVSQSDQYRQYGQVMFTAALVYDWCYDLLTEEDKNQIIAGVEHRICRMENSSGLAMEVGFPPSGLDSVSEHGAEHQILRDYLSFAVAIYDELPSWWNYIGGRVYNDHAVVRNYLYQSGVLQQGTGYFNTRHGADLAADWILTVATGSTPFDDCMHSVVRNMLGYEVAAQKLFKDGDAGYDYYVRMDKNTFYAVPAYIAAYLYEDSGLLAQANFILGDRYFGSTSYVQSDPADLSPALFVALRGLSNTTPAEDRHEGMPLIQYNGHTMGQYIIRNRWSDEGDAAIVLMRIKQLNTGCHEHEDSGTFEIYYKGMLSSGGGVYASYYASGKEHTEHFYNKTISKNGLIVYNPSIWDYSSDTETVKWYSGGQITQITPKNFNELMLPKHVKASVTGRQHAYIGGDETNPLYAYIAGDITKAYNQNTVNYVGRRMLTVYTGNADFPMAFFVYDDVESDEASYEKRFLLQITSPDAPTVDGTNMTITTEHERGRLVLTSLSDNVAFRECGGRMYDSEGNYDPVNSRNYLINGVQCYSSTANKLDDGHWGRIEIVSTASSQKVTFMNVLYVTDKGQTKAAPNIEKISGVGVEGGVFGDVAAIFATSRTRATTSLSATVSGGGNMNYYVSGVAAGEWNVSVDGKDCGTYTATAEGGLLTFTAPDGKVEITPVK